MKIESETKEELKQIFKEALAEFHGDMRKDTDLANMNMFEAAQYLNISESRLYTLCCERKVNYSKDGKFSKFKQSDLDEYVKRKRFNRTVARI